VRWCVSIGAVLVAAAVAGGDVAGFAAPNPQSQQATPKTICPPSISNSLSPSCSYSMDLDELAVQREGYAEAIVSKDFLRRWKNGPEPQGGGDVFRVVGNRATRRSSFLAGD